MNDAISSSDVTAFPTADSLCEECGYALRGLVSTGDCPECGKAIELSNPVHRQGLPWQRRATFRNGFRTVKAIITSPRAAFDSMIVASPSGAAGTARFTASHNRKERLFLFLIAMLAAAIYSYCVRIIGTHRDSDQIILAPIMLVILTYIEALGVTYFSRKRGWRVPWRLAERIVCYASIGWLPAMFVVPPLILLQGQTPFLPAWASWIPLRGELTDWLLIAVVGGVASLWFESLVWLGVRRLRYANG